MEQKKKRLFIATSASGIENLMEGLDKKAAHRVGGCFGGFFQSVKGKNGRTEIIQKDSAYYDDDKHEFVECTQATPEQCTLVLIADKLGSDDFKKLFRVDKSTDYLISHLGMEGRGIDRGIVELFNPNNVKNSHHMPNQPHAIAFEFIFSHIHTAIPTESIIDMIWSKGKQRRKDAQRLFSQYYAQRPQGDCPMALNDVKEQYEALKTSEETIYTQRLVELIDAFVVRCM